MDSLAATSTATPALRKRRSGTEIRRHERRALARRIELTSKARLDARTHERPGEAYLHDVELLGQVSARQLIEDEQRRLRVGLGRARRGAYDPYLSERADGLLAAKRVVA